MTDQIRDLESQLAAAATEIEKIDILHILAWELKDRDPQRARLLAQTAHDLARLNDYASGLAHSLKTLGFSNGFAGEYELALAQLLEAKTLFEELDERSGQSTVLWILGAVQWHLGNYGEALEYSLQALQIAEEIGNRPNQAEAINNIAIIYGDRGDQ
ncbi:MAG TPA: tetratricopeptide repeat protein, partial [Anaerolineae bacterium]|nr:tetratricopeptide repeat protein [Anaerolineae bacterium]